MGDILVSACPCVCMYVCMYVCVCVGHGDIVMKLPVWIPHTPVPEMVSVNMRGPEKFVP